MSNDKNLSKDEIITKLSQLSSVKLAQQYMSENSEECSNPNQMLFRNPTNHNPQQNETPAELDYIDECMYEKCKHREKGDQEITLNSRCRNCGIVLCSGCRQELKVLQCTYCNESFICSRHCYSQLLNKDKNHKMKHLMPHLQFQSLEYQFQVLGDHVFNEEEYIDQLCFRNCAMCGIHNCGCKHWICCRDCQKFYCPDCRTQSMQKCGLEECECFTCCYKQQWDRNCFHCNLKASKGNKSESCGLLFCTRGHCTNHIIRTMPSMPFTMNENEKEYENEQKGENTN